MEQRGCTRRTTAAQRGLEAYEPSGSVGGLDDDNSRRRQFCGYSREYASRLLYVGDDVEERDRVIPAFDIIETGVHLEPGTSAQEPGVRRGVNPEDLEAFRRCGSQKAASTAANVEKMRVVLSTALPNKGSKACVCPLSLTGIDIVVREVARIERRRRPSRR